MQSERQSTRILTVVYVQGQIEQVTGSIRSERETRKVLEAEKRAMSVQLEEVCVHLLAVRPSAVSSD